MRPVVVQGNRRTVRGCVCCVWVFCTFDFPERFSSLETTLSIFIRFPLSPNSVFIKRIPENLKVHFDKVVCMCKEVRVEI